MKEKGLSTVKPYVTHYHANMDLFTSHRVKIVGGVHDFFLIPANSYLKTAVSSILKRWIDILLSLKDFSYI